jgi:hypothetical protein
MLANMVAGAKDIKALIIQEEPVIIHRVKE